MNISPSQFNSYGYSGVYSIFEVYTVHKNISSQNINYGYWGVNSIFEVYTVYLYKIIIYILFKILIMAIEVYTV